jgi:hypothetical protein
MPSVPQVPSVATSSLPTTRTRDCLRSGRPCRAPDPDRRPRPARSWTQRRPDCRREVVVGRCGARYVR